MAIYAVVVRERGRADQINTSGQHVQADVLPRARQAPGIVSGFWMTDMAGATLNVMVFESEDAARSALEPVRSAPAPRVVALATTELPTVIEQGKSGYISCNIDELVEHMRRLLIDPVEARRLGEHEKKVAQERFGLQRFIHDWNAAFARVL